MANKGSTFFNMTLTLMVVTLVASTSLGFVYELTKGPIEQAKLAKKLKAIDEVVKGYDNSPINEMYLLPSIKPGDSLEVYPAKKGDILNGVAIKSSSAKGYGGDVWLMVGLNADGIINNISVLDHKETPGLGTKMNTDKFKNQFLNKNPAQFMLKPKKDGGDVDALTGATISTRAFCEAVENAYQSFKEGGQHHGQ